MRTPLIALSVLALAGCHEGVKPAGDVPASTSSSAAATTTAAAPAPGGAGKEITMPDGLKYEELKEGTGATPNPGQTCVVHYTGWLVNGVKFDSSVDRGQPFEFPLGQHRVIQGWDEGVATMKVGGKRK